MKCILDVEELCVCSAPKFSEMATYCLLTIIGMTYKNRRIDY